MPRAFRHGAQTDEENIRGQRPFHRYRADYKTRSLRSFFLLPLQPLLQQAPFGTPSQLCRAATKKGHLRLEISRAKSSWPSSRRSKLNVGPLLNVARFAHQRLIDRVSTILSSEEQYAIVHSVHVRRFPEPHRPTWRCRLYRSSTRHREAHLQSLRLRNPHRNRIR